MKSPHLVSVSFVVIAGLTACAWNQKRAVEAASHDFSCPEDKIAVTEVGENQYRAVGCGKKEDYLCERVTENAYTAQQSSSIVCQPVHQAVEEAQRTSAINSACAERCNSGGVACQSGCGGDSRCRSACDTLSHGCFDGCVSSAQ